MSKSRLIQLYAEMAELTLQECRHCLIPYHCCDPMYCQLTIEYAKSKWDVELIPTGHARLPLMGNNGCIAAPHLRPMCTAHTCELDKFGGKLNDPEWIEHYWTLRNAINALELEGGHV